MFYVTQLSVKWGYIFLCRVPKSRSVRGKCVYSSERGFDTILGSQLHQFKSKINQIFKRLAYTLTAYILLWVQICDASGCFVKARSYGTNISC